jgi:hypothetical protein
VVVRDNDEFAYNWEVVRRPHGGSVELGIRDVRGEVVARRTVSPQDLIEVQRRFAPGEVVRHLTPAGEEKLTVTGETLDGTVLLRPAEAAPQPADGTKVDHELLYSIDAATLEHMQQGPANYDHSKPLSDLDAQPRGPEGFAVPAETPPEQAVSTAKRWGAKAMKLGRRIKQSFETARRR